MARTELATRPAESAELATTTSDLARLGEALAAGARDGHLVSPATSCGALPQGFEVALSAVRVDASEAAREVYPIRGGGFGLSKTALNKIAAGAGVSWDPHLSRRLDDCSDPHFCRFHVVGRYRHFDGQWVTIQGTKTLDLRDGSPQADELTPDNLRAMRVHIESHCETKAQLRAIRSLGIKTSYTREELTKPFVVAKLMATGRTEDPELARRFATMQFAAAVGANAELYGPGADGPAPPPQALPPRTVPPPLPALPPRSVAPRSQEPRPAAAPSTSSRLAWPWKPKTENDPAKGTPLASVGSFDLERLADYYEKNPGNERFASANAALVSEARRILAERAAFDEGEADDEPGDFGEQTSLGDLLPGEGEL